MRECQGQRGGITLEAMLEVLLVLIIVPPLVTCALQAVLVLASIVLPWVALVAIVFIVTAGLAVIASGCRHRPNLFEGGPPGDLPALPPIDRPKVPGRRREDDDLR